MWYRMKSITAHYGKHKLGLSHPGSVLSFRKKVRPVLCTINENWPKPNLRAELKPCRSLASINGRKKKRHIGIYYIRLSS